MPGLHALVSFFKETPASYFIYSCWKLLHLVSIDLHATHAIEKCNTFSKHILLYKFQDMFRITLWFECQYIQLLANAYINFSWHSKRCDKIVLRHGAILKSGLLIFHKIFQITQYSKENSDIFFKFLLSMNNSRIIAFLRNNKFPCMFHSPEWLSDYDNGSKYPKIHKHKNVSLHHWDYLSSEDIEFSKLWSVKQSFKLEFALRLSKWSNR